MLKYNEDNSCDIKAYCKEPYNNPMNCKYHILKRKHCKYYSFSLCFNPDCIKSAIDDYIKKITYQSKLFIEIPNKKGEL